MRPDGFDCTNCPGYCCTYDEIPLTDADLVRLSDHLGAAPDDVIIRYTKYGQFHGKSRYPLLLKHKPDRHFGTICTFFDEEQRRCTVYEGRPDTCRNYPHAPNCGYYDFLVFERQLQGDDDHVAVTR